MINTNFRAIVLVIILPWGKIISALPALSLDYNNPEVKKLRAEVTKSIARKGAKFQNKIVWRTYKIKPKDNFFIVMARFLMNHDTLSTVNSLASVWDVEAGDVWLIPNARGIAVSKKAARFPGVDIPGKPHLLFIPGRELPVSERNFFNLSIFIRPVQGRLSSGFGMRKDPFENKRQFHKGIDIACALGSRVVAAATGKVVFVGTKGGYGKAIILKHKNAYRTLYGHLSKTLVRKGQMVKKGEKIGLSGQTGLATGPHLHFEVHRAGKPTRPDFKAHSKRKSPRSK